MTMKKLFYLLLALAFCACRPTWVRELESKNPHRNAPNFICVYFRFDTIINDFEVSGILYPSYSDKIGWSDTDNGVLLFFHSLKTSKEYVWTDWDENAQGFRNLFASKNVQDICFAEGFKGFHDGDKYIFSYDTTSPNEPHNDLYPNAEYQFYDVDFDGEQELLINYYHGGPYSCTCYEVFEITDSALVRKEPVNEQDNSWFSLDDHTKFDAENKTITSYLYSGCYEWGEYVYRVDNKGDIYAAYSVHNTSDVDHKIIKSDTIFIQ